MADQEQEQKTQESTVGQGSPEGSENGTGGKTFTQEEVNSLLQRETDRRVTEALKKADDRLQSEMNRARKEAEERSLAEKGEYQKLFEARQKELDEERRKAAMAELRHETVRLLSSHGVSFLEPFFEKDLSSIDARRDSIQALKVAFDAAVESEIGKRLKSENPDRTPPGGGSGVKSALDVLYPSMSR